MSNPVETWKAAKHGFDVWSDVLRYAADKMPMSQIDEADLERMKWHGFYYRKRDEPGRYMNRIRLTGNELSADQAREVAYIAYEFGHGIVDVTTRANVQVQGLDIENVPKVAERLAKVGLTSKQTGHDNIRNVFCHSRSGVDPDEIIDCRPLCREIDEVFLDSRVYSDLPRKFNIALNGIERHAALYWTQDISFLATRDADGEAAFHLLVGGTQGQSTHLGWYVPVLVRPDQVAHVSRVLLDLFRAKGSREKRTAARFKYVVEAIGVAGVLDWLDENLPYPLLPSAQAPLPATGYEDAVGWFRQKNTKLWSMGVCVPLGRLSWRQLEGLAVLAKRWGSGQLRTSAEQGLTVLDIPTGFRDAAATDAAALGLSVTADTVALNTVACTGQQFCNIAVTETKGHMFQLMERLRRRGVVLQGIRIHMSGCPSSCAGHFTADIGLKGVRVRRLLGTREGFDVLLGGGVAGQVHLGTPYKLGVDVDQLPNLVEQVVAEYYLKHRSGQTFSAYWREKLQSQDAQKVGDRDLSPPIWICEKCDYRHAGEDPPVFCPSCAGLRRYFARLESGDQPAAQNEGAESRANGVFDSAEVMTSSVILTGEHVGGARDDGFVYVADFDSLKEGVGREATVGDKVLALFRIGDSVHAIDNACPHEGAPLAEGEFADGCVVCPWHAWTFNARTGCSIEPKGHKVESYAVKIEEGRVYVSIGENQSITNATLVTARTHAVAPPAMPKKPVDVLRTILSVIDETHDVKTFHLDNADGAVPFDLPGKFLKVCFDVDGRATWRSFTVCSSPARPEQFDVTIKLNPVGEISRRMFKLQPGDKVRIKGTQGAFCFDPARHTEPLVLASAGSGVTPMMSIVRYIADRGLGRPCLFLHGARERRDILFDAECQSLAGREPWFKHVVTLSRPGPDWAGPTGRITFDAVAAHAPDLAASRFFLCGPNEFMESLRADLLAAGVPAERIHTEQFHAAPVLAHA